LIFQGFKKHPNFAGLCTGDAFLVFFHQLDPFVYLGLFSVVLGLFNYRIIELLNY